MLNLSIHRRYYSRVLSRIKCRTEERDKELDYINRNGRHVFGQRGTLTKPRGSIIGIRSLPVEMQNTTSDARRNIRILVERLKEIKEGSDGDSVHDRQDAEDALLDYIADPEVKWAFQEVLERKG